MFFNNKQSCGWWVETLDPMPLAGSREGQNKHIFNPQTACAPAVMLYCKSARGRFFCVRGVNFVPRLRNIQRIDGFLKYFIEVLLLSVSYCMQVPQDSWGITAWWGRARIIHATCRRSLPTKSVRRCACCTQCLLALVHDVKGREARKSTTSPFESGCADHVTVQFTRSHADSTSSSSSYMFGLEIGIFLIAVLLPCSKKRMQNVKQCQHMQRVKEHDGSVAIVLSCENLWINKHWQNSAIIGSGPIPVD